MKLHPFDGSRHPARALVELLASTWIVTTGLLWAGQELLVYPGVWARRDAAEARSARAAARGVREVRVPRDDGGEVVLWHVPADGDDAVLFFHGNAMTVEDTTRWSDAYHARGIAFVAMEYRGFHGVPGWPTEAGLVTDARVAWGWVTSTLGVPPDRVLLHGESLGGGVASALAAEVRPPGLVLGSTFDSLEAVAAERVPFAPVSWLLRSPFRSADRLVAAGVPTLVAHARDDGVVPFERGAALAAAVPGARFVAVDGAQHAGLTVLDREVERAWADFVERSLPRPDISAR